MSVRSDLCKAFRSQAEQLAVAMGELEPEQEQDGYTGMLTRLKFQNELLRHENAKLRELVRDMFGVIEDYEFDPIVERQGKRGPYYEEDPSWRVGIRDRARQLGVEVEE